MSLELMQTIQKHCHRWQHAVTLFCSMDLTRRHPSEKQARGSTETWVRASHTSLSHDSHDLRPKMQSVRFGNASMSNTTLQLVWVWCAYIHNDRSPQLFAASSLYLMSSSFQRCQSKRWCGFTATSPVWILVNGNRCLLRLLVRLSDCLYTRSTSGAGTIIICMISARWFSWTPTMASEDLSNVLCSHSTLGARKCALVTCSKYSAFSSHMFCKSTTSTKRHTCWFPCSNARWQPITSAVFAVLEHVDSSWLVSVSVVTSIKHIFCCCILCLATRSADLYFTTM